jgi:hypothetical protein
LGLAVCCLLLVAVLVSGALAQSSGPYQVESGTISGGGYRLTIANWQVSGTASGEGYRLIGPVAPELRGSGCCCTYLPLVVCNTP